MLNIQYALLFIGVVTLIVLICCRTTVAEPFVSDPSAYKSESAYTSQVALVTQKYGATATSKRPVRDLLAQNVMPESEQNFVNFYAHACRFTGYIGPMKNGYLDPDVAVQMAVHAGCRVFVLDIDYLDDCTTDSAAPYFPQLVVRDAQGKLIVRYTSNLPMCNNATHSTIRTVCEKINFYAFADSCQQSMDPVVIVLYFLRQPPGSYKSKLVLDYYSNVAKALAPFESRLLQNEMDGGTFYRQKQEGRLLINKITDYNGKVLIFSNANTTGFREVAYDPAEDLDFMTNLRLSYTQTKLGVTDNESTTMYGILQTAEDFTMIPADRVDATVEQTKLCWSIALSRDPTQPVSQDTYHKITRKMGVHCVPAVLFDPSENDYMFTDKTFKTYGFIPKPDELRYIKPPIITPAKPNPSTDAKQGMLRAPTI
jgi:hypothetical protein